MIIDAMDKLRKELRADVAKEALKATPEFKDWQKADEALHATPAYKNYKEAEKALYETPEWKTIEEIGGLTWEIH